MIVECQDLLGKQEGYRRACVKIGRARDAGGRSYRLSDIAMYSYERAGRVITQIGSLPFRDVGAFTAEECEQKLLQLQRAAERYRSLKDP